MADNTETLKRWLNLEDISESSEGDNYETHFSKIAELLLINFAIVKGTDKSEIVEIEFYLFTPSHPDVITYPRITEAGQWFFHQSGVDITFKSDGKRYGGILIRGIKQIESIGKRRPILGPLKCMDALWDKFDAFNPQGQDIPHLEFTSHIGDADVDAFVRWIPLYSNQTHESKIAAWNKNNAEILSSLLHKDDSSEKQLTEKSELAKQVVFTRKYRFSKHLSDDEKKGYQAKFQKNVQS